MSIKAILVYVAIISGFISTAVVVRSCRSPKALMPKETSLNINSINGSIALLKDSINLKNKITVELSGKISSLLLRIDALKKTSAIIKYKYDTIRVTDEYANVVVACDEYIVANEKIKQQQDSAIGYYQSQVDGLTSSLAIKDEVIGGREKMISSLMGNNNELKKLARIRRSFWLDAGAIYLNNSPSIKLGATYFTKKKTGYSAFVLSNNNGIGYGASFSFKIF